MMKVASLIAQAEQREHAEMQAITADLYAALAATLDKVRLLTIRVEALESKPSPHVSNMNGIARASLT